MNINNTSLISYTPKVAVPTSDPDDPSYIISPGGEYDGVVQIGDGNYTGTGALLNSGRHILTAAHVVEGMALSDIAIAFDLTSGRQTLSASQVHIHNNWENNWGYDIAIVELTEDAPTTGYEIYRGSTEIDSTFSLVGYGGKGTGNTGAAEDDPGLGLIKRKGDNTYEALNEDFNSIFGNAPESSMLFYDFDDGTSARDALGGLIGKTNTGLGTAEVNSVGGDSGGPNFISVDGQLQIAGIVSGGNDLGSDYDILVGINSSFGEVSHDTRISYFADWIDNIAGTQNGSDTDNTGDNSASNPEDNDTYIVQRGIVGKGAGNDVYVIASTLLDSNATLTISDTQGQNSLQLIDGLTISSSQVANDTALLNFNNGSSLTILGASSFSYIAGGDPLTGLAASSMDYSSFVINQLGIAQGVPTSGVNSGTEITITGTTSNGFILSGDSTSDFALLA